MKKADIPPKIKKILIGKKRPIKSTTCVLCGSDITPRFCKNAYHTPYVRCRTCDVQLFLRSPLAIAGFEVISKFVKNNINQFKALIEKEHQKKLKEFKTKEEDELLGLE